VRPAVGLAQRDDFPGQGAAGNHQGVCGSGHARGGYQARAAARRAAIRVLAVSTATPASRQ
jgi:hypothetical protein